MLTTKKRIVPRFPYLLLPVASLFSFAAGALAQTDPLVCNISSGGNLPTLRAEGVTELAADLIVTCTGGTPIASGSPIPKYSIMLVLNTGATARIIGPHLTDALLL